MTDDFKNVSPARRTAFDILLLVEDGGYASDLLLSRTAPLETRDAGLASEIVFGVLRFRAQLDFLIRYFSGREKMDVEVRTALRMGIYQLRYLDRVPAHAAVAQSVELVKAARKRSAAGFVNAVLRKVHRQPVAWPDRATELSIPAWLLARWDREFGEDTATRIARAFLEPAEKFGIGLRFQDIGSQAIVPLLGLARGQTFLDVCAAPGNKTAQAMESGVVTVACDIHWNRLKELRPLGCGLVVLDATRPLPFNRRFDRILADVPCSGTGTLGRNPEIRWRLKHEDLEDLHARQVKILRNALDLLAPGGVLVYATCSLEREENEAVVEEVTGRPAGAALRRLPGTDPGDGFFASVLSHL
jgi:16S rRNA (cytosine967-C5)-methyltransferase